MRHSDDLESLRRRRGKLKLEPRHVRSTYLVGDGSVRRPSARTFIGEATIRELDCDQYRAGRILRRGSSLIDARQRQNRNFALGLALVVGEQGHQFGRCLEQPSALGAMDLHRSSLEFLCTDLHRHEWIRNQIVILGRITRRPATRRDDYYPISIARVAQRAYQRPVLAPVIVSSRTGQPSNGPPTRP